MKKRFKSQQICQISEGHLLIRCLQIEGNEPHQNQLNRWPKRRYVYIYQGHLPGSLMVLQVCAWKFSGIVRLQAARQESILCRDLVMAHSVYHLPDPLQLVRIITGFATNILFLFTFRAYLLIHAHRFRSFTCRFRITLCPAPSDIFSE